MDRQLEITAGCGISNRSINRELLTTGGPSTAGEGLKVTTPHHRKTARYGLLHRLRTWTDSWKWYRKSDGPGVLMNHQTIKQIPVEMRMIPVVTT